MVGFFDSISKPGAPEFLMNMGLGLMAAGQSAPAGTNRIGLMAPYMQAATIAPRQAQQQQLLSQLGQAQLAQAKRAETDAARREAAIGQLRGLMDGADGQAPAFGFEDGTGAANPNPFAGMPASQRSLMSAGLSVAPETVFKTAFGGDTPSSLREWQAYSAMSPTDQERYLTMKRANPFLNLGGTMGQPSQTNPGALNASIPKTPPPETAPSYQAEQEAAKAEARARAEATEAAAKRTKQGETMLDLTDGVDDLIKQSTGSGLGAAADYGASFIGKSTSGAEAADKLKVLQASLMLSMPRMEGPQSDRDVELYRQAVGSLGDPTIPARRKLAAVKTVRELAVKYGAGGTVPEGIEPETWAAMTAKERALWK